MKKDTFEIYISYINFQSFSVYLSTYSNLISCLVRLLPLCTSDKAIGSICFISCLHCGKSFLTYDVSENKYY